MNRFLHLAAVAGLIAMASCAGQRNSKQTIPQPSAEAAKVPGRISSVNAEHQFVVLNFTAGDMPEIGTRLNVYRETEMVGAVQITEPVRGHFATADILEGELRVGDEAH